MMLLKDFSPPLPHELLMLSELIIGAIRRNDVHHRSPGKSFLQPLVSLQGLIDTSRWGDKGGLEVAGPSYGTIRSSDSTPLVSNGTSFGGIEHSVETSWSYQVRARSLVDVT